MISAGSDFFLSLSELNLSTSPGMYMGAQYKSDMVWSPAAGRAPDDALWYDTGLAGLLNLLGDKNVYIYINKLKPMQNDWPFPDDILNTFSWMKL